MGDAAILSHSAIAGNRAIARIESQGMQLAELVETSRQVGATSRRSEKIAALAAYLRRLRPECRKLRRRHEHQARRSLRRQLWKSTLTPGDAPD